MIPRLQKKYKEECIVKMQEKFGIKNYLAVPKLEKIIVSMGVGKAISDMKILDSAVQDLSIITGQKPLVTRSKKAISNFKLRENLSIGCKVTLRRSRMYEFLDRFINFALPRVRDFKGVSDKSFDGRGSYTTGVREQIIFVEVEYDKIDKIRGMNITFVTNAKTDNEAKVLLKYFGMPFRS